MPKGCKRSTTPPARVLSSSVLERHDRRNISHQRKSGWHRYEAQHIHSGYRATRLGAFESERALWEQGDFTEIAVFMRQSGEAVVQGIGIEPPVRVLDLGCGDGTTAIPLARLGAEVVGIDIARNLVEAGNRRAAEAGLTRLKFQEGDACNLEGVADSSFDLLVSIFGAMFAP